MANIGRVKDRTWDDIKDIDPYEDDDKPAPQEAEKPDDYEYDEHGEYNLYAGSQSPTDGRCNALLKFYEKRYGEPRYCTRLPCAYFKGYDRTEIFCKVHRGRKGIMKHARNLVKHGMMAKSFVHYFDGVDPVEKIMIIGMYECLISDSVYDFDCENRPVTVYLKDTDYDLNDVDFPFEATDEVDIAFPSPSENVDKAGYLLEASVNQMKMLSANSEIFEDNMSRDTVTHTEGSDGKITDTIEEKSEHYLNLPYSRLVRDQSELLKMGGVDIEGKEAQDTSVKVQEKSYDEIPTQNDLEKEHFVHDDASEEVAKLMNEAKES